MEYGIIEAATAMELEKKVNAAIADGWMPLGGVSAANETDTTALWIMQAITREVPNVRVQGTGAALCARSPATKGWATRYLVTTFAPSTYARGTFDPSCAMRVSRRNSHDRFGEGDVSKTVIT